MQPEEDRVKENKDLDAATITEINKYKVAIVKRINFYLQNLKDSIVIQNLNTHRKFKVESVKHHLYRITLIQGGDIKSIIINGEPGSEALELNRSGKPSDEYLGLTDLNSNGGSMEIKVDPTKIRILGSFQSFKNRMDQLADEIINSTLFIEGN